MSRASNLARAGLLLAGALILALAMTASLLESSGWLARSVRAALQARLGAAVELSSARFAWSDFGLDIEGLVIGSAHRGLELDHVEARWRRGPRGLPRLSRLEIRGGRLTFDENLRQLLRSSPVQARGGPAGAAPTIIVHDLELSFDNPSLGLLPIGLATGMIQFNERDTPRIEGRIAAFVTSPSDKVRNVGTDDGLIYVSGSEASPGVVELTFATENLAFSVDRLPRTAALEPLRVALARGLLSLDARFQVRSSAILSPRGSLRARIFDAALQVDRNSPAIDNLTIDLEATCAPRGGTMLSASSWSGRMRAAGKALDASLVAWGSADAQNPTGALAGAWARAWLQADHLPVGPGILAALGLEGALGNVWKALEPRGRCSLLAALEVPLNGPPKALFDVTADGDLTMAYHGFPNHVDGVREGFPMPVDSLRGRFLLVRDGARERPVHMALVGIRGEHTVSERRDRDAWIEGQIRSPARGREVAEYDLHYGGRGIAVDGDGIPKGLAGLTGADWIWPEFRPHGGNASFEARMRHGDDMQGMSARFDIDLQDVGFAWRPLPVTAADVSGRLSLVFAPHHGFGAAFEARGRTLTSESLTLNGRVQGLPHEIGAAPSLFHDVAVAVENVSLRGVDRDAVVASVPELSATLESLAPSGKADVRLRTSRAPGSGVGTYWLELEPREARLAPQAFRVQTSRLRGRLLVQGKLDDLAGARTPPSVSIAPLVGDWPSEAVVAASATFDGHAPPRVRVWAAGLDPQNRGLVGALRESMLENEHPRAGLDLSALSVNGRVDASGDLSGVGSSGDGSGSNQFNVYLRDNDFRTAPATGAGISAGLGLDRMRGVLVQRDGVLRGEGIRAQLGSTQLTLRDAKFSSDRDGYRLEARPEARALPLDREHLSFFLDQESVDTLIERLGFRGTLDLNDALLSFNGSPNSEGRVEFAGQVRLLHSFVEVGLPLEIERADLAIQNLVYEGTHVRAWLGVKNLDGSLGGRRLQRTRMQLVYVEPHLSVMDLDGVLEGGTLSDLSQPGGASGPAFSIDLAPPFPFGLSLRLADVHVEGLLRGLFESEFASKGFLSGDLRLNGSLEHVTEIRGDGELNLSESTLWSIPVMRALFSQLGLDNTAVFERMRTRLSVQDGQVEMSGIQVYSPLLQLVGSGHLDFDGRLNHDLEVRYGLVDQLGPLTRLVYWIQNNLLRIAIRGDMARPRVALEGLFSFLRPALAGGRDLPLPPLTPLPERF